MSLIERDEHRIVVLQCDECGEPRAGCRALDCALSSRPYAGEDVVPVEQLRGAVARAEALERAIRAHRDALRAGTAITEADRLLHRSLDPALGGQ
jgi:hypothetical protein